MAGGARHVQRVQPAELASRQHHHARAEGHRSDGAPAELAVQRFPTHPPAPGCDGAAGCMGGTPSAGYAASGVAACRRSGLGASGGGGSRRQDQAKELGLRRWWWPGHRVGRQHQPIDARVADSRWCAALRRDPLQVGQIRLRLGSGGRRVVDDLALVGGDGVDRVEQKRRVVHRYPPQHGRHPLPTDLSPLDVVDVQAALEDTAADELHRVREVRQRQQPGGGALGGVIDVVEVGQAVRRDVQNLFQVVVLVGEQLGELRQLVHLADQRGVVVLQESADVGQRLVERPEGVVEVG